MRIVVIGGVPRSLVNFRGPLLRDLVERGHEVIACAPNADWEIKDRLKALGVIYCHVPLDRASMNPFRDLETLWRLIQLFRKLKPDIVMCYTIKPVIWGSLAARFTRIPRRFAMITGLGYAFQNSGKTRQKLVNRVVRGLYQSALKGMEIVFFQNPDDEAEFRFQSLLSKETPSILVNGSGVDLSEFTPQSLPSDPVFLLMARLIADKGIREYRQAAQILHKRHPEAKFLLAGGMDSNPSAISETELAQWQAEGDIEYLGNLNDVRPALAQCGVYVLPSYYREGTPRTVLEAMATGRPIITTDSPGCRETVDHGINGYLAPPKNANALADAMEDFIIFPEKREKMGKESLRLAREKYDVNKVNGTILNALSL